MGRVFHDQHTLNVPWYRAKIDRCFAKRRDLG
jgi:hypothetical protein